MADPSPPAPPAALARLMVWLSPAFPVGGYSYSHGLEWAVAAGGITERATLVAWLEDLLRHGGPWQDAVLFAAAWRDSAAGDDDALDATARLAASLAASAERRLETMAQGRAFADAVAAAWPGAAAWPDDPPYPVAVAVAAHGLGLDLATALNAYLTAFAANLVSASVRLIPLGQTDGLKTLAALEPVIASACAEAAGSGLDGLGGAAFLADIASMKHETQETRLFRS